VSEEEVEMARSLLRRGAEVGQMMKVVGEEGTSIDDFVIHLKAEYVDASYLQQDAFHDVDSATSSERQQHVFGVLAEILRTQMTFADKEAAREFFHRLTQTTKDWNRIEMHTDEFNNTEEQIRSMVSEVTRNA
jgi:V/A-type H+-transporting ATPase subunit A